MATANNFLSIVQWVFRQTNRRPPTSLTGANNFTQVVMDSVNAIQRNISEIGKDEQWKSLHGSSTFPSVIGQRQYSLPGANDDIDPSVALRRLFETDTPSELEIEASELDWRERTLEPVTTIPDVYRVAGTNTTGNRRNLLIELDPIPEAVRTYTYEYYREIADLTADADISVFPEGLLKYGALGDMLNHKGKLAQRADEFFASLLERERNKQTTTRRRMVYGARPTRQQGIGFSPRFGITGDD
jgi:hypothetical protein